MWQRLTDGVRATLPLALGVAPFGIAYGTVAGEAMMPWQASLMSVTVFAGTAQFVTASMLSQGAGHFAVLITGLLINMRMVLMSASLAAHLDDMPRVLYIPMAHLLTDESFAVSVAAFEKRTGDPLFVVGSGLAIFITWQMTTALGLGFGTQLPTGLGLEYALPASLICLLFLLIQDCLSIAISGLAALLSLILLPLLPSTWSPLVATLIAVTLGVIWKQWQPRG
ncbi:MAG: AzlC family ABC transporter permease [Anaerolineae bacterium]